MGGGHGAGGHPGATDRLRFRTWREDDGPLAWAIFGDPRVTALVGGPFDESKVRMRLSTEIANEQDLGFQYWPIFLADGTHVGCCGLKPREPKVPEMGFYLRPEHWGCGYAVEAGRAVLDFAYGIGSTAVFAGHHPENRSSRAVLERLGFRYVHDELYPPTGLRHPGYLHLPGGTARIDRS